MLDQSSRRMATYTGLAAVAVAGGAVVPEANADLMIFDVGTTFTMQPVLDFGGTVSMSTLRGSLQLEDLNQTMSFFAVRFTGFSSGPFDEFRSSGWSANFDNGTGAIAKNSGTKMARNFGPGESVDSKNKFKDYAVGGFDKTKIDGTNRFSKDKGVMDGQVFLGFTVPSEGLGIEATTFGWVDLTLGEDETGRWTLTINRWAYESDAGTAAQIPGGTPVPGVSGLFGLALGAAGIRGRRERVA